MSAVAVDYMNLPTKEDVNPKYAVQTADGRPMTPEESLFIYYLVSGLSRVESFVRAGMVGHQRRSREEKEDSISSADRNDLVAIRKVEIEENAESPESAEQEKEKTQLYSVLDKYPNIHITKNTTMEEIRSLPIDVQKRIYSSASEFSRLPWVRSEYLTRVSVLQNEQVATTHEIYAYLTAVMRGQVKDQFGLDAPLQERTRAAEALAKRLIDLPAKIEATQNLAQSGALQINIMPRTETIIDVPSEEN